MSPLEEDTAATDDQPATKGVDPDIPACPNCGELRPGPHCAWCGQNDRDYRRSSWSLIADFFRETFEPDSKLFRTLKLLVLKPGRLSAEASMRHFYEDGWIRTLFKAFLLVVLYMALFTPIYFAVVAAGM